MTVRGECGILRALAEEAPPPEGRSALGELAAKARRALKLPTAATALSLNSRAMIALTRPQHLERATGQHLPRAPPQCRDAPFS